MKRLHIDLICRSTASAATDAIRDHTLLLRHALAERPGTTARAHDLRLLGQTRDLAAVLAAWPDPTPDTQHVVLLAYNPYSFDRHGVAWWLPGAVRRLRRARPRIQVVLLVHELWVAMNSVRHSVVGPPQRMVFMLLRARSDRLAVSTESLLTLASRLGRRTVAVLPVGSNLPDARAQRGPTRLRLGIGERQHVIAAFGTQHPSRLLTHIHRAVEAVAACDPDVVVLNLGASAPPLQERPALRRVLTPGHLAADDLARHLATVDLLLLPFSDGAATRRTTVMAGLQHALPILSTDGRSTSAQLRSSRAIALVDSRAQPDVYALRACALLADEQERRRLGQTGRALYETRFAWPVIAEQVVEMLEQTRESP